ncbi:XRE family transcriptional regulator [Streptomyces sp. QH1-20]|uniref:XRE family transcriptional regulator n=1 Tax=Streptomyces sp. QH1-20 TaxID=3240934 RepID=UPI00351530C2
MTDADGGRWAGGASLPDKLDRLVAMVTPDGETPHYKEIARSINEAAGERVISSSYIWKLHKGEATNPRLRHLEVLAQYFDVPTEYFLNDDVADRVDEQLKLLSLLKTGAVRNLALRVGELSPESLRTINGMIDRLHALERPDRD